MTEPVIYELGSPGRCAASLPALDVPESDLPHPSLLRESLGLPEVSEIDLVRHYTRLSHLNYAIDLGMYPLGSCTMKYNPKVNEVAARLPGFAATHPYQPEYQVQGNLHVMHELQRLLAEIGGFGAVSLQPAAGAHGELAGVLMIRAYHLDRGDTARNVMLIPDSAHGTNPASTAMAGFEVVEIRSDERGNVDLEALRPHLNERLAGMMLTNPNTLGLFDEHLVEICRLVHEAGGLMYGDGANLNALLGAAKPGELGFDVMHYNLHKTFSTPHGGGGPGAGPVGAGPLLAPFLPGPVVVAEACLLDVDTGQRWDDEWVDEQCIHGYWYTLAMPEKSIGRLKAFYGQYGVLVRALTYIRMLGAEGLAEVAETAVLNANYLLATVRDTFAPAYDRPCMHECVLVGRVEGAEGVRALDIAKRLIDHGVHPPTNYFPLTVSEALMIEPTETESKQSIDAYVAALKDVAREARENPQALHDAPVTAPVRRLDEVQAARHPILRWHAGA